MQSSNRWGDIYDALTEDGFDVYEPAQHQGECTKRYIVVKLDTCPRISNYSSVSQYYDLMLYIPKGEYSQFEDFVAAVKQSMKKLEPMIMPLHSQTASYYDDGVKGHMISIQYRNSRKL